MRDGQREKSLEFFDKAIRISPHDPTLVFLYSDGADAHFGLKQYDQVIEWAGRSIAINPNNNPSAHGRLIAALALSGREAEARDALQRYLALPTTGQKTIAAWKAFKAELTDPETDPQYLESWDRTIEGLRKAGMPEE